MTHCDFSVRSARDDMRHIIGSSEPKPPLSQVLDVFSVVIQFHCLRDRAGLTRPQKLIAGLGGSRSMERHIRVFNFNVCSLVNTGRMQ